MDILQLYQDFNVDYQTEGHKHCRPGWANIECPFCSGNPGLHLGYNIEENYFFCWRCGWHPIKSTLSTILNLPERDISLLLRQYGGSSFISKPKTKVRVLSLTLPSNVHPLHKSHISYLEERGFDPYKLIEEWKLLATGPSSILKTNNKILNYQYRILIPIYWDNEMVSFDARDVTGKSLWKYMACPDEREVIARKSILYGRQDKWTNTIIVVEGPTDVWKMGYNSGATFGTKYTNAQVRQLSKFKRVAIMFDGPSDTSEETEAANQAKLLVSELKFRGVDAFRVPIIGDPGSLPQSEADYLVKQIIK